MLSLESDGRLLFEVSVPDAESVEVVGSFHGWHLERHAMVRHPGEPGRWRLELPVGPGDYLFRYLLDGDRWMLDHDAHGLRPGSDGTTWSRAWVPVVREAA